MAYMMDYEGNEITQEYAERVLLAHLDESKHARRAATMTSTIIFSGAGNMYRSTSDPYKTPIEGCISPQDYAPRMRGSLPAQGPADPRAEP